MFSLEIFRQKYVLVRLAGVRHLGHHRKYLPIHKELPAIKELETTSVSTSQSGYCSLRGSVTIKIQKRVRHFARIPVMAGTSLILTRNFRKDDGIQFLKC